MLETELKLRADEAALRTLATLDDLGPARLGPAREADERDLYLDTPDGALAAARWACRLRARDGRRWISCKGPAEHAPGDPLHRRPEVEGPAPEGALGGAAGWPDSAARDLVLRLAGDVPLVERISLRQLRTERGVMVDGARVATLSLDRVGVERDGARLGGFAVVELELAAASRADALEGVVEALLARSGLAPDPLSKLERALELARGATGAGR
jgi:inorganic triphosphatase YgiF